MRQLKFATHSLALHQEHSERFAAFIIIDHSSIAKWLEGGTTEIHCHFLSNRVSESLARNRIGSRDSQPLGKVMTKTTPEMMKDEYCQLETVRE